MRYTLYVQTKDFYVGLKQRLEEAEREISMSYLSFQYSRIAKDIAQILIRKARKGVKVRLMVDYIGNMIDTFPYSLNNIPFLEKLRRNGIEVIRLFSKYRLGILHMKMCAIDGKHAFVGGSNIGEFYQNWKDIDVCISGKLDSAFHDIFDYVAAYHNPGQFGRIVRLNEKYSNGFELNGITILLCASDYYDAIYKEIGALVRKSKAEVYMRSWNFLPDEKMMKLIESKLKEGTKVNILISDRCRILPIDVLNRRLQKRLEAANAIVHRYKRTYMHSKAFWNSENEIIIGSANLASIEKGKSFELSVKIQDRELKQKLTEDYMRYVRLCR